MKNTLNVIATFLFFPVILLAAAIMTLFFVGGLPWQEASAIRYDLAYTYLHDDDLPQDVHILARNAFLDGYLTNGEYDAIGDRVDEIYDAKQEAKKQKIINATKGN
jgi:hypothetical protein